MSIEHFEGKPRDKTELEAEDEIVRFFRASKKEVFYSRQVEVTYEHLYFHWVTLLSD